MTAKIRNNCIVNVLAMLSLSFVFAFSATAKELDGVVMPDTITITGTDTALQLNGMGYRTKFVFNVYVGALYTEKKVNSRDAVQVLTGPKRVAMHMVYDEVAKEKMGSAWLDGFEENNSDEQFKKLKSRLDTLISYFPDLVAGDIILLDYVPAQGTRVTINDVEKGVISGADFYLALLDVWLGEEPADDDLKDAMLGNEDD